MTAQAFCAAGGVIGASRAIPTAEADCQAIPDPLASWTVPGPGSCRTAPPGFEYNEPDANLNAIAGFANSIINHMANNRGGGTAGMDLAMQEANTFLENGIGGEALISPDGTFKAGPAEGLTLEELLQISGEIDNVNPALYANDRYADSPTATITPGTYCGLDVSQGHLKMTPGVYHIKDGPLTVRRRATLTGDGVTIILSGEKATFSILDEARLTLSAPVDGNTAGFALVEDKSRSNAGSSNESTSTSFEYSSLSGSASYSFSSSYSSTSSRTRTSRLTGSGEINAIGTIYLPNQDFRISGSGAGEQASPLLQIVANRIDMRENGKLSISFDPTQTEVPVGIKPARTARLVN